MNIKSAFVLKLMIEIQGMELVMIEMFEVTT
jgi:hypothetical protein